jgi:hypothetical protein
MVEAGELESKGVLIPRNLHILHVAVTALNALDVPTRYNRATN